MNRGPAGLGWLLVLVLPSALGLLGFGVVGLIGNTRELRQEAREESRTAARAEARSLQRALDDPAIFDRLPAASRFTADADNRIAMPEGLGPARPEELVSPRPAYLSYPVERRLARAAALEFEADDPIAAIATLEEGLADARDDEDLGALLLRQAWCAQRAGLVDPRAAALERFFALETPSETDLLSALLLDVATGGRREKALLADLVTIPEDEALLTLARLSDLAPERGREIEMELRGRLERRARLYRAQARMPLPGPDERSRVEAMDGDLLLVQRATGLDGRELLRGAIIAPEVAVTAAGFDPARFVFGSTPPEDAVPAVPLVAALPARFGADQGPAEFGFTALLLAGLVVAFVGGLVLATRALRREAQAARTRSDFLTSVTHELKTPLASIRLIAEMLEQGIVKEPERRDEYHRLLSGETARLSMLIENVLDLGRMERGERAYDRHPAAPADVVRDAVEVFRPVAKRDGLEVEARLDAAPAEADIDRGALVQALLNLLENGRKYALAGGRLELEDECRNGVYRLRLRDFGPGIPGGEIDRVFERFTRGSAQADGRVAGVGLGLHLARRIVEDHGGKLRTEQPDDDRGGALFVMELPAREGVIRR